MNNFYILFYAYVMVAIFYCVFFVAGHFLRGGHQVKLRYYRVISLIAITFIEVISIAECINAISRGVSLEACSFAAIVIGGIFHTIYLIRYPKRPSRSESLKKLDPIYDKMKALDKKNPECNLLFYYLNTRKRRLEKELISDNWCTEEELRTIKEVFKVADRKSIKYYMLIKMLEDVREKELEG